MDQCFQLFAHLASLLEWQNFNVGHHSQIVLPTCFILKGTIKLCRSVLRPCLRTIRSTVSKIFCVRFLIQFSTDQDKVYCGVEGIQMDILMVLCSESFTVKGNDWYLTGSINIFKVSKQFYIYERISLSKGGMTLAINTHHIFILVLVTLTFIQGLRIVRKWKLCGVIFSWSSRSG